MVGLVVELELGSVIGLVPRFSLEPASVMRLITGFSPVSVMIRSTLEDSTTERVRIFQNVWLVWFDSCCCKSGFYIFSKESSVIKLIKCCSNAVDTKGFPWIVPVSEINRISLTSKGCKRWLVCGGITCKFDNFVSQMGLMII